jgi:phosphate transport system substrate-binding protein
VTGDEGALGYFGFSYFEENQDSLKAVAIDNGNGCVAPSVETAQDGSYAPLSRPLFVYVKSESLERPEVEAFVTYTLENAQTIAQEAQFVPLNDDQVAEQQAKLEEALA